MKHKIGDKVMVTTIIPSTANDVERFREELGKVGEITNVDIEDEYPYIIDGVRGRWRDEELELVEPKKEQPLIDHEKERQEAFENGYDIGRREARGTAMWEDGACTQCGSEMPAVENGYGYRSRFCPHCGRLMVNGEEDDDT